MTAGWTDLVVALLLLGLIRALTALPEAPKLRERRRK
jgi:hypothetical protein